ncbi:hypothetical protein AB0B66_09915 [Catellatospora sp. NPDC049111]|uniref:hypothetical protein n=1 Tax=Catellatospora sp. NPDC049111 TaxID=3155271 RepID=UPI0033E10F82
MRRAVAVLTMVTGLLLIAAPAQAFAHNRVTNPLLHTVLELLTIAVVLSPVWTAFAWGPRRRGLLVALIALVQVPVAIIGFVPIPNPVAHAAALITALGITVASIWTVRRSRNAQAATTAAVPR